ncbi:MAG: alpha/beta hydrolase [Mycobacterium sp.]
MRFCEHAIDPEESWHCRRWPLVHGGGLAADSWELTINEIHRLAPELTVFAPDLPGRRSKPGDLRELTIADFVDSVVGDIESAGLDDVVIVGHSIGAVTVLGAVRRLGMAQVREMVLAAALMPAEGGAIADSLAGPAAALARYRAKKGVLRQTPWWWTRFAYLNGIPRVRRRFMRNKLYGESPVILTEDVSRPDIPDELPRTWILTTRDRALSAKTQRKAIEALGGAQALIEMDTCHCMMVSEPERLAEILVERCRLYE